MQPGFEIIGAKSKKGGGEEPPAHAPMAPRGPGRTSLSGDQKKVRRQMAKSAGAIDTIESMLSGLEPDQLQELWDLASEEQRKATDRKTQDAIATARGAIMRQFQKWGMEPVTATTAASDFQGGGMLHALWIKILEWIIGHNGYSDYADEYAFASLRPQGTYKEITVDISIQREAALLQEMDGASLDRQREIAGELDAIGRARVAAFEADREIDFGGAVVRDTLTPVVVAAVHTASTDWLDEAAPERDLAEVQRSMTTAASAFYTRVHEAAKADPEEYRIQAEGMASLVAGAHAPFIKEATDAFMRHALFLNRSAMTTTAVTLTEGNIESEAERVAEEAREQAWGDILDRPGDEIEEMVDDICARRYPGDPLAKDVADQAVNIVMFGSKRTAASQVRCSKCGKTTDSATAKAQDAAGWGCAGKSGTGPTGTHDWKPVKEAADADINPYPANEQAGYAESGLPASVPVEGYDAEGISDEGAFENYAPKVAPENVAAEAEEGDRTPMPGFGEQVTSAVDAGMRSVDTPLWGFQSEAQRQVVAQQHTAAGIPESVGNGESYPMPCVVIRDHGRKSNYQYQADVIWSPATLATVAQGFDKAEVLAQAQSYASNEGLPLYDEGTLIQNPQALSSRRTAASYGERAACKVCNSDIEFHGDAGWIDRGGNSYCDESGQHPLIDGGDGGYGDYPHVKHEPYVGAVRRTARRISAASTKEALGFTSIEALTVEGDSRDMPNLMAKAINGAALSRGIRVTGPSDALDMSRDIILDEAAASLGCTWEIKGDTLRIWPLQYGHTWPIKEGSLHTAADGMTCATCGDTITRDPEGEENRTWHHTNGTSHDHEAKPSGSVEASRRVATAPNEHARCAECGNDIYWSIAPNSPREDKSGIWVHSNPSYDNPAVPGHHEAKPSGGSKESVRTHVNWQQGVAPSGAEFFKAKVDGYDIDVRPLREGEGEPGWWTWSVTGTGDNGPRNKHGQAADRDEAEEIALGIVDNQDGFTMESAKTAGVYCNTHQVWVGDGNAATHTDCSKEQKATDKTKTAGTDPDDQAGTAESGSSTPETNSDTMWPWELPAGATQSGQDAANVAAVPTPGASEADYPQPKGASARQADGNHSPCPDHPGQWYNKSTGDCSCGASHGGSGGQTPEEWPGQKGASRNRDIAPTEQVQSGDTVRVIGGFEDGVTGKVTRGGWHESRAYGYTVASNNAFAAYYIDVAGTEIGPFRSGDIEKV